MLGAGGLEGLVAVMVICWRCDVKVEIIIGDVEAKKISFIFSES